MTQKLSYLCHSKRQKISRYNHTFLNMMPSLESIQINHESIYDNQLVTLTLHVTLLQQEEKYLSLADALQFQMKFLGTEKCVKAYWPYLMVDFIWLVLLTKTRWTCSSRWNFWSLKMRASLLAIIDGGFHLIGPFKLTSVVKSPQKQKKIDSSSNI